MTSYLKNIVNRRNALKRTVVALALLSCSAFAAAPADTVRLSLNDVLTMAVQHNPLVHIERLDVDLAKTFVAENRYKYEPSLSLSVTENQDIGKSGADPETGGSVQLTQQIPTGGSLQFRSSVSPAAISRLSANPSATHAGSVDLIFNHALLQGAGPGANLASIRKARADVEYRREELAGYAQKTIADAEKAYWDYYLAGKEIAIRQRALNLANRLLYESEERLRVGRAAPVDLIPVKAEVASRERALIETQSAYEQKRYRLIYLTSDSLLLGWEHAIAVTDTPSLPEAIDSLSNYIALAMKYRPDLRQAHQLALKGELDISQTRNGLLPKLDLFIALQGTAYSESFGDALSPRDGRDYSLSAGLTLGIPATNGAARARHTRATLTRNQIDASLKNVERLIEMEVRTAYSEILKAEKQIATARRALVLQEENLAAEHEKLSAGKTTSFFVLQAQRDLTGAQLDEARERVAYAVARSNLYLKNGSLLEYRGVSSK